MKSRVMKSSDTCWPGARDRQGCLGAEPAGETDWHAHHRLLATLLAMRNSPWSMALASVGGVLHIHLPLEGRNSFSSHARPIAPIVGLASGPIGTSANRPTLLIRLLCKSSFALEQDKKPKPCSETNSAFAGNECFIG